MKRFELLGGQVLQGRMPAPGIVVSDVVGDLLACDPLARVGAHLQFHLDAAEARLHEGIVVAVVGAAHALQHARAGQHAAVLGARILPPAVGVMHQVGRRPAQRNRGP